MTNYERILLEYVCRNDLVRARAQAKLILEQNKAKKDQAFCDKLLQDLQRQESAAPEIPYTLRDILATEDVSQFCTAKYLIRPEEEKVCNQLLDIYRVSERLAEIGIHYNTAIILHGQSGCGKTELAKYIAYKANLPFLYIRFSSLLGSLLGETQKNLARVFQYVQTLPCVLCFDELDAIGMTRGESTDVGEMSRIVIALMQELDQLPNNVILIGTTNRFDRLDPALVRRFPLSHKVQALSQQETRVLCEKFFSYAQVDCSDWLDGWMNEIFAPAPCPAFGVVDRCTEKIIAELLAQQNKP